jgi:hypothetical protein
MAQKTDRPLLRPHPDLGTDYALLATAAGGALLVLIYLILI